jgi:hypothetical protein
MNRKIKTPPFKLHSQTIVAPRARKRLNAKQQRAKDDALLLVQAESAVQAVRESVGPEAEAAAALYGRDFVNVPPKSPKPTVKMLIAGGKTVYESFVREAGYAKDARILPYEKLKVLHHKRWEKVAADVFKAMEAAK